MFLICLELDKRRIVFVCCVDVILSFVLSYRSSFVKCCGDVAEPCLAMFADMSFIVFRNRDTSEATLAVNDATQGEPL